MVIPKLSKGQYKYMASAVRTVATSTILGGSAVLFLPETFQLTKPIPIGRFILLLFAGLSLLIFGVIIEKKGEER